MSWTNHRAWVLRLATTKVFTKFPAIDPGAYFIAVDAHPWYAIHPPSHHPGVTPNFTTAVDPSLDVAYPTTFYDSATERSGATLINLKAGDRLQLDIHLSPVPALRVLIHVPTEGPGADAYPFLQKAGLEVGRFSETQSGETVAPGLFEMSGIAPGKYVAQRILPGPAGGNALYATEVDLRSDGQEVTLPDIEPPGSVKFSVKFSRDVPVPNGLLIRLTDLQRHSIGQFMNSPDHVQFGSVAPGNYSILVASDSRIFPIVRAVSNGQLISPDALRISAAASLEVTLFLDDNAVAIQGYVKHSGFPIPGAMVVLVSTEPTSDFLRRDQTDSDGSFTLPAVFPGSYKVIALEDAWTLPWPDATTLRQHLSQAQPITVAPTSESPILLPAPLDVQAR